MSTKGKGREGVETPVPSDPGPVIDLTPGDVKLKLPDNFDGTRSQLDPFLAQCELYFAFNHDKFKNETQRILWIVTMLRGAAFNWISPFLIDYTKHRNKQGECTTAMRKDTITYFHTMEGFGNGIRQVFGDIEEEATAERDLGHLRQKGAAAKYSAEFQQLAARVRWGQAALRRQFYIGLKDGVKDEIARSDKPNDLRDLIEMAIKIDNRMYERSLEKRGTYSQNKRTGGGRPQYDKMQVDATTRTKPALSKEEMNRRREKKLCFQCGLPGHMANSHKKNNTTWKKKKLSATGPRGGYNQKPTHQDKARQICVIENVLTAFSEDKSRGRQHRERRRRKEVMDLSEKDEIIAEATRALARVSRKEIREQCQTPTGTSSDWDEVGRGEEGESHTCTSDWGMGTSSEPEPHWPENWPARGQVWEVVQREVFPRGHGTRVWYNHQTKDRWNEPGEAVAGGPEWGTKWEVVFQDMQRVGWREVGGAGTFMLRLPLIPAFEGSIPKEGETWELRSMLRTEWLWVDTNDEARYFREEHPLDYTHGFEVGQVYRVQNDPTTPYVKFQRRWLNVLWEYYPAQKEVAVMGDGQQLIFTAVIGATRKENEVRVMIDTGATGNFISPELCQRLKLKTEVTDEPYSLTTVNGEPINDEQGLIDVRTTHVIFEMQEGHMEYITFDVAPIGKHEVILGMPWMEKHNPTIDWKKRTLSFDRCKYKCAFTVRTGRLRPIPGKSPEEVCATSQTEPGHPKETEGPLLTTIPEEYHEWLSLFMEEKGIEALPQHGPYDHEIPLEKDKELPFSPIYGMSENDLGTLREYIDTNLKKGFIRPSTSPAGSPVLLVPKKDGTKRLCVDYRKLNAITIKDRYALPLADELRDRLQGATIFTKLDLRGAYNLVRMKAGEEPKTAFRCRYGHYEYTVMPFGLCNAPATCMRMINDTLRSHLDRICIAYLDDILVYSETKQQHVKDVRDILTALKKARLLCKPEKCEFHTRRVDFLGYVITPGGISMDPSKVNKVLEWHQPTTVTEVQSFLGFANFYRRFVKGYSTIAAPLTELTKKDKEFEWTKGAQDAFVSLKEAFTKAPVLVTFDPEKEITVETDSSDYALGAVLSQKGETNK
jgi:hypothetical protein